MRFSSPWIVLALLAGTVSQDTKVVREPSAEEIARMNAAAPERPAPAADSMPSALLPGRAK